MNKCNEQRRSPVNSSCQKVTIRVTAWDDQRLIQPAFVGGDWLINLVDLMPRLGPVRHQRWMHACMLFTVQTDSAQYMEKPAGVDYLAHLQSGYHPNGKIVLTKI